MKKFLSIVLAVCMVMTLGVMAHAETVNVSDTSAAQDALHSAGEDLILNLTGDVYDKLIVDWRTTDEGYDNASQPDGVGYKVYPMQRDMGDLTIQGNGTTKFAGLTFNSNLTKFDGSDGAGGHHVTSDAGYAIGTLKFKDVEITERVDLYTGGANRAVIDSVVFENVTFKVSSDICAYIGSENIGKVIFNGCTFNGVTKAAIEVSGTGASDIDITVDNCTFDNPTRAVLMSSGSYNGEITLTNNKISTNGDRAFRITSLGSDAVVTIENNTAYENGSMVDGDGEILKINSVASGATVTVTEIPSDANVNVGDTVTLTDDFEEMTMSGGKITGGTFSENVSQYLADGLQAVQSGNEFVVESDDNSSSSPEEPEEPGEDSEEDNEAEEEDTSEPTPEEIERDRIVAAIKAAADGETVTLDVKKLNVVSRFIADAMSGKNVNLEYTLGEETVTVNGKNVPKTPAYRVWYSLELFSQFA